MRGRTTAEDRPDLPSIRVYRRFDRGGVHALLLEHLFGRWLSPTDFAA
jgi:hypothetical protein